MVWLFTLANCNFLDAQLHVGLDNWFNHETNPATGKPYHYLWSDTEMSGYSRWGKIFESKGVVLSQEAEPPTVTVLKTLDMYIIVDPDTTSENPAPNYITTADARAIEQWVKNGGVLVLLANDVHNCEFTHLNQLSARFGIQFNPVTEYHVTNDTWSMGTIARLPGHPIFSGVKKIFLKDISTLSIHRPAKAILKDKGLVVMAGCRFGKGYVFALGDPWIYNEYIDHDRLPAGFDNRRAAENFTSFLLSQCRKK